LFWTTERSVDIEDRRPPASLTSELMAQAAYADGVT